MAIEEVGKDHRGGTAIRKKMTSIDMDRLALILPSLFLPSLGIFIGVYLIMARFVDWDVPPQWSKRETLNLGLLCLVLGVINLAVFLYVISL